MAFTPYKGTWTSVWVPKKASTLYTIGAIINNDGTDNTIATTSSTGNFGICATAYGTDDATTARIKVWVPRSENCTFLGDVGSGTPAVANIGKPCDIASGGLTAAWGTNTSHQLFIRGYISATVGEFSLNHRVVAA